MAALDNPFFRITDDDGHAVSGGKLRIRDANTTDLSAVYSNAALSTPLTNPVEADSAGFIPPIYIAPGTYDITRLTAGDVQIGDVYEDYEVPDLAALENDIAFPVVSKSADFTVVEADRGKVFEVDASAAPGSLVTVTAEAGTLGNDFVFFVVNSGASGDVTIQADTGETFDGGNSFYTLDDQNEAAGFVSRGAAGWRTLLQPTPIVPPPTPQGRLTLTPGTPVLVSDVTSATAIYYTPYTGNGVPIYDGSALFTRTTFSELTLNLNSNSGHTLYHQSGKMYDLYVINDGGTVRLVTGAQWTNDTTRSEALTRLLGFLVNNATMTARYGTGSGDTVSVPANKATYVGTVRMSADGTTKWTAAPAAAAGGGDCQLLLYNQYNRSRVSAVSRDSTDSQGHTSGTWRNAMNSATNRVSMVRGQNEESVDAIYSAIVASSSNFQAGAGVGVDSTSAISGWTGVVQTGSGGNLLGLVGGYSGWPGLGYHYIQALEYGGTGGSFKGDSGDATAQQMALRITTVM